MRQGSLGEKTSLAGELRRHANPGARDSCRETNHASLLWSECNELRAFAEVLGVDINWLLGDGKK